MYPMLCHTYMSFLQLKYILTKGNGNYQQKKSYT